MNMSQLLMWKKILLVIFVGAMAILSVGRIYTKAYADNSFDNAVWGVDFYQFWYGGQFFWQGEEPYTSMRNATAPDLMEPQVATYLAASHLTDANGRIQRRWPVTIIPGAAPLFLLLAPFALLPWIPTSLLWSIVNLGLGLAFVWILLRLTGTSLASFDGILLCCLFFSLLATRQVLELGQTSLIIVVSMFGALVLAEKHPLLAGSLLAVAISKYTLGFPVFLYFLYRRWYKALLSCIAVQALAIAVISVASGVSPSRVVQAYALSSGTVLQQTEGFAIHILALGWGMFGWALTVSLTAGTAIAVLCWHLRRSSQVRSDSLSGLVLIGIGSMWSLASIYHGRQDMVVAFVFTVIVLLAFRRDTPDTRVIFDMSSSQKKALTAFAVVVFLLWTLPLYTFTGNALYRDLYALVNVSVVLILIWLLCRIRRKCEDHAVEFNA